MDDTQRTRLRSHFRQNLEPRQQLVLLLTHADQLSEMEIGQVLGLSCGEVRRLHAEAMQRLRACLARVLAEPSHRPHLAALN